MADKVCDNFPYINKIRENVLAVDVNQLQSLHDELRESDCIVILGSGRSARAMSIPASQMAMAANPKTIISPDDIGFPGANLYEAAPVLEKNIAKF